MWDKVDRGDFDNYKREVWERHEASVARFAAIEKLLAEKTPESIEQVREALQHATADEASIRKKAEESEAVLKLLESERDLVGAALKPLKAELTETTTLNTTLRAQVSECQQLRTTLVATKAQTDAAVAEVAANLEKTKGLLKQAEGVPAQIEAAGKLMSQCEGLRDNIQGVVDHSIARKTQIDEVHNEIFGQDLKGSDGSVGRIEGLRDKIKTSFDHVVGDLAGLKDRANADVSSVAGQLKALMPGAMATGLSAAYEAKANAEISAQQRLEKHFVWAIGGLAAISLIPFAVDVYLLARGMKLLEVIRQTPVLPILPLYFPVLWFAYSTNKKVNLSKRLIEEYTHKSVLGKTFSGLSNQIDSLSGDPAVTHDLRLRLLYNVLQVSAENPGKLITDYSKADHPIVDVLESSSRLSGSVEALRHIPGFAQLARVLADRQLVAANTQAAKVVDGLGVAAVLNKG